MNKEIEKETEQEKALRDFMFEVAKSSGILWLISKMPFLKYKKWVEDRIKTLNQ